MNRNLIIIAVIIVVAVGGFILFQGQQGSQTTTPPVKTQKETQVTGMQKEEATGDAMEKKEATDTMKKGDGAIAVKTVIETKNFTFAPKTLRVKKGEKVTFINRDTVGHSVTSDDGKSFDTGVIGKDETAIFTAPMKIGTYPFHCTPHPNMKATLVVE